MSCPQPSSAHKSGHVLAAGKPVTSGRCTLSQDAALGKFEEVHRIISLSTNDEEQTGNLEPLKSTTNMRKQLLPLSGERLQPFILDDPGVGHYKRFEQKNSLEDLDRAIDYVGQAIDATPEGNSDQARYLENLRAWLRIHDRRNALMRALSRCVELFDPAVGNEEKEEEEENDVPLRVGAPEGETIYANTPQHHGTVQLLRIHDKSGT